MILGIDPSINGTGLCLNDNGKCSYFYIVPKATKKTQKMMLEWSVELIEYKVVKTDNDKTKEIYKSERVYEIQKIIEDIIDRYKPERVVIEAIAYAANGSIDMLAGLNYSIRNLCIERGIELVIVSPTTLKKSSVGTGKASKDLMMSTWKLLEGINIDCDDLADAYFLSNYYC